MYHLLRVDRERRRLRAAAAAVGRAGGGGDNNRIADAPSAPAEEAAAAAAAVPSGMEQGGRASAVGHESELVGFKVEEDDEEENYLFRVMKGTSCATFEELLVRVTRNDPAVMDIACFAARFFTLDWTTHIDDFDNAKAFRLGRALTGNTVVTLMSVAFHHLHYDTRTLAPMFNYIEESPSLRKMDLHCLEADPQVAHQFLLALSKSRSVQDVLLHLMCSEQVEALVCLLESTTIPLKKLKVYRYNPGGFASTERFATGFGNNKTLKILDLDIDGSKASVSQWFALVLRHIQGHPCLESLTIENSSSRPLPATDALNELCRLPPKLNRLELQCFAFQDERGLRAIYDALHRSDRSLSELVLNKCHFDLASTKLLQEMLQPATGSVIRSLEIKRSNQFACPIGTVLGNVFSGCSKDTNGGAQLEALSINEGNKADDCYPGMFQSLGANATHVTLRSLSMDYLDVPGWKALIVCLPELVHLKKVYIRNLTDCTPGLFAKELRALEKNGSLEIFRLENVGLTQTQSDRVKLYFQRNAKLPRMIVGAFLDHHTGDEGNDDNESVEQAFAGRFSLLSRTSGIAKITAPRKATDEYEDKKRTPVRAYPKLFRQALRCPATGPTLSFAGLLTLNDAVGPQNSH